MVAEEVPTADPALLAEAVTLAQQAGDATLDWFRRPDLAVEQKVDGTPVTAADRAAERFLRDELVTRWPDDGVLGEEEPERPGTSGRRWILDPIDGTKAFTRGVPTYSTLLALEDAHGIALGVIHLPALGETVAAGRGLGCTWNGTPTAVEPTTRLEGALLTTSAFDGWADAPLLAVKAAGMLLRTWGDGYGYVLVATGRAAAMVDPQAELYDLAPMPVVIAEAGGRFTDLRGRAAPDGGSGLATAGPIHDELLGLLGAA
jgi:histidinol-phosphatase